MARVTFREDRCKGCGLCIHVCPKQIILKTERESTHMAISPQRSWRWTNASAARSAPPFVPIA